MDAIGATAGIYGYGLARQAMMTQAPTTNMHLLNGGIALAGALLGMYVPTLRGVGIGLAASATTSSLMALMAPATVPPSKGTYNNPAAAMRGHVSTCMLPESTQLLLEQEIRKAGTRMGKDVPTLNGNGGTLNGEYSLSDLQ